MQQFHKLRREVEKNVARLGTVNGGAQFKNSAAAPEGVSLSRSHASEWCEER